MFEKICFENTVKNSFQSWNLSNWNGVILLILLRSVARFEQINNLETFLA